MGYAKTGRKWHQTRQTPRQFQGNRQDQVAQLLDLLKEWQKTLSEADIAALTAQWDGYHGHNPALIQMQTQGLATDVDARGAWLERERTPIGKDTGIKIVAPNVYTEPDPDKPGKTREVVHGYHIAYLFDIRHTIPSEPRDIHPVKDQWNLDHPESFTRPDGEPWPDGKAHRSWGDDEDAILEWHRQHDPDWTL